MFDKVKEAVGPRLGMLGLTVKEKQPEIFLTAGIVTGIGAAVMFARAHKKSEEVFQDVQGQIEATRDYVDDNNSVVRNSGDIPDTWDEIPPAEERKMLFPLYVEASKRATILYGPSVLMGIASVALILASHKSLQRRNRALVATATLLERSFNIYRKRVRAEMGEEADERFYYGADARKVNTVTIGEDGKKKKKKETKNHIPEDYDPIMYQRIFDNTNQNWNPIDEMSLFFLKMVEEYSNNKYTIRGWMTLNEVYKDLGFVESPEGAVVGWSKNVPGDGFISFNIDSDINQREGDERYVLDFNVDGLILNHIGDR